MFAVNTENGDLLCGATIVASHHFSIQETRRLLDEMTPGLNREGKKSFLSVYGDYRNGDVVMSQLTVGFFSGKCRGYSIQLHGVPIPKDGHEISIEKYEWGKVIENVDPYRASSVLEVRFRKN